MGTPEPGLEANPEVLPLGIAEVAGMAMQSAEEHSAGGAGGGQPESEPSPAVARRLVFRRVGLATAVGAAAASVLSSGSADAATGDNLVLGQSNNAGNTSSLGPTSIGQAGALLAVDGSTLNSSLGAIFVQGPDNQPAILVLGSSVGGVGVQIQADSAGVDAQVNTGSGVSGFSGAGKGVDGSSDSGVGVHASSTSGTALSVLGTTHFSRSGAASVSAGSTTKTVKVPGMTSASLVLATLQTQASGVYVASAVPAKGQFTLHLSKKATKKIKFAWFVVSG